MQIKQICNKFHKTCMTGLVALSCLLFAGCETMQYVGEDFDKKNQSRIATEESFVFRTYKKYSTEENIELTTGVSFTPVNDVLVIYANLYNLNKDSYNFLADDFSVKAYPGELDKIPASAYLSLYQAAQSQNYQDLYNVATKSALALNAANPYDGQFAKRTDTTSANSMASLNHEITSVSKRITAKTVKSIRTIQAGEAVEMYFFIKDVKQYPIEVNYKDLKFVFNIEQ